MQPVSLNQNIAQEVVLHPGDYHFSSGNKRIRTLLGSCVSITVWHPVRRIGGMCHYLLPNESSVSTSRPPGLYADAAVKYLVQCMRAANTQPGEYITKIFGGGYMFERSGPDTMCSADGLQARCRTCADVSCKNVMLGRELLLANGFRIATEHTGGSGYRQLVLDLRNGDVWMKQGSALGMASSIESI